MSDINPVFIISLPRSGSTLLQRIIATNPRVSTVSESWLLLPLLSMHTSRELYSEYGQRLAKIAINEFTETLPDGINDFRDSLS
ncbi:MAG: sulfotransferase, partial [Candidatus Thiodiazotropha endolucinida]